MKPKEGIQMKRFAKAQGKQVVGTKTYRFAKTATRVARFGYGFGYQQKQTFGRVVCHTQKVVLSHFNWRKGEEYSRFRGRQVYTS